ncbi:hypothetical protein [Sanyastnella coralliicola]|uniref:hypothetical protein n=1 Tax=Sanyastnella coralliicola TaxID=3069118 RepID=UPI0027B99C99|nr:hypothetical protein [Longitalea sp. SCSIO 12813]
MKKISAGTQENLRITGANVDGLYFNIHLQADAVNTAIGAGKLDLSYIDLNVVLDRDGQSTTIVKGNLQVLLEDALFHDETYDLLSTNAGQVLTAHGASTKAINLLPFIFELGGIINLRGGDALQITLDWKTGSLHSDISESASYAIFGVTEGIGLEYVTPIVKTIAIQSGQDDYRMALGDNVMSIVYVNTDKTSIATADRCIQDVNLRADKFKRKWKYEELLGKRLRQFSTLAQAGLRYQSFQIFSGHQDLDDVTVEFSLEPTNINVGKNYLVVRSFEINPGKLHWANRKRQRHQEKNEKKFLNAAARLQKGRRV